MRTLLLLAFALLMTTGLLAQSHGLTYQAVILDSEGNITEIPGYDIPGGNYLPNKPVDLRFTILNEFGGIDYQEEHATTTDLYGMISVIIGDGVMTGESPDVFMEISWDGTPKDLRVEVSIAPPNGTGEFEFFSLEKLVFVPYAYHRNITATGTMDIDGATTLNSTLEVFGVTDLNAALNVNNGSPTYLSGDLTVDGETNLNNGLNVNNGSPTYLSGTLTVDQCLFLHDCLVVDGTTDLNNGLDVNNNTPTNLTGTLNVNGASTLNSTLDVDGATTLNTTLDVDGSTTLNSYLDVDGGTTLNSTLDVDGATTLNGLLDVDGPTTLNLTLDVDGAATLNNTMDVDGATTLNSTLDVDGASLIHNTLGVEGQTTITANLPGGQDDFNAYPLRVQGSTHGIAVKVNGVEPSSSTNFITFFDGDGTALGCVEGQVAADVYTDPEYIYNNAGYLAKIVLATGDLVAAAGSSTVCAGLGACVTAPVPSLIIGATVGLALAVGKPPLTMRSFFRTWGSPTNQVRRTMPSGWSARIRLRPCPSEMWWR
ncbi:MAG: hypothetical protein IPK99_04520 [Flavobacteriales bacterium]|nr:hypothetical protein [Flavobacteriales bacterium]